MTNFWTKLRRPFFSLAPMSDVTDSAFRQIIARYGKPDVFFTEFVSTDSLASPASRPKLLRELYFTAVERPIVAQVFGAKPVTMTIAAGIVREFGFDGLDINMGCPDKAVVRSGAGAALIKTPHLAKDLIAAAKQGAGDLPVSIKTRLGFKRPEEFRNWLPEILATKPAALTVHLRSAKEESEPPAHWEMATEVAAMARAAGVPVIGNGDVKDLAEAEAKTEQFELDGVMLGRAVFGNPWLFIKLARPISPADRIVALIEHIKLFADLYLPGKTNNRLFGGYTKNFAVMKKHFKAYIKNWPGTVELRARLMTTVSPEEAIAILDQVLL